MPNFLSHFTYSSSPDKNGFCHSLSIDAQVYKKSSRCKIHRCHAWSNGGWRDHRHDTDVLAKFLNGADCESASKWANGEVNKSTIAQRVAVKFNNFMDHMSRIQTNCPDIGTRDIEFQIPQICKLDDVAQFSKKKEEVTYIVVDVLKIYEPFLCITEEPKEVHSKKKKTSKRNRTKSEGDAFHASGCRCLNNLSGRPEPHIPHPYLHAFVHYFYIHQEGNMAIDCLKGSYDSSTGYTLSPPIIHSRDKRFGGDDQGIYGMRDVIKNHVCSSLCRDLPKMALPEITEGPSQTGWNIPPHPAHCHHQGIFAPAPVYRMSSSLPFYESNMYFAGSDSGSVTNCFHGIPSTYSHSHQQQQLGFLQHNFSSEASHTYNSPPTWR